MQKLIGDKEKFAIQYNVTSVEGEYVYGHICYWINNKQIGDYTSETIISDVLIFLPQMIKDNGQRENAYFFNLNKEQILYLLGGQAYCDSVEYVIRANKEIWARFNITLGLDVFGNSIVELIDYLCDSRIVFYDNLNALDEIYLKKGEVDEILLLFFNEINALCGLV